MNMAMPQSLSERELLQDLLLEKQRKVFPNLAKNAYLNFGAQGLICQPALDAINAYYQRLIDKAPFTIDHTMDFLDVFAKARANLAETLGVDPHSIALVENTSMGCNIALWGVSWRQGDRILISDCEYPGVIASIEALVQTHGLIVDTFTARAGEAELLGDLEDKLRDNTRMVVISHITWSTGALLPLKEICDLVHGFGSCQARVLVDGAQSVGVLPLNLKETGVDFYAFTAHKWLCAPEGTGGFYLRDEIAQELRACFVGPRSINLNHQKGDRINLWDNAQRFEISTQCTAHYAALNATLEVHRRAGSANDRFQRLNKTAIKLWQGLRALQAEGVPLTCLQEQDPQAGLVFFRVADNRKLVLTLEAANINIRIIPTENCVRVSIHYMTLNREVVQLLEQIRKHLGSGN